LIYYSTTYGTTWSSATIPSNPWTFCAMSANRQYIGSCTSSEVVIESVTRLPSVYTSGNAIVAGNVV
jgi:hypothetical protein